jgi:hypothetical protein
MNDLHDKYMKHGETIYVGQPDSVYVFPGKNRIKVSYRSYDPKVAHLTVYWDFRQGSASFDVPSGRRGEPVEIFVDNLAEKQYTFELVTTDIDGKYPSVPFKAPSKVYGSRYASTLTDRKIESATIFPIKNNQVDIAWAGVIGQMIGVELLYHKTTGGDVKLFVDNDATSTRINDSGDGVVLYRTLHLPEETCIDTFYTEYTAINLEEMEDERIDRSKFKRWNPPGIPYRSYGGEWGNIETVWNGNLVNPGFLAPVNSGYPFIMTFDLGQNAFISRIKTWPRVTHDPYIYSRTHAKKMRIYGSPTENVTDDLSGWILLGECNSIKPSGDGPTTAEDLAYAKAGEEFLMTNTSVPVRYIRLDAVESWPAGTGDSNTFCIMELELYGAIE